MKISFKCFPAFVLCYCANSAAFAVEAPQVYVSGSTLNWALIDAIGLNVHSDDGSYIETLPGDTTSWLAPKPGGYFIVGTDNSQWQNWGKSNVVAVTNNGSDNRPNDGTNSSLIIDDFYAAVYSQNSVELFWSLPNEGVQEIEIFRDDGQMNYTNGRSLYQSNLQPGTTYSYRLKAFDAQGNSGPVVNMRLTTADINSAGSASPSTPTRYIPDGDNPNTDNDAPSLPKTIYRQIYNSTRVELMWPGTIDNSVENYTIFRDGEQIGKTTANSYYLSDLLPGTDYTFVVTNIAGTGIPSNAATTSFTTSGVSPVVSTGRPPGTLQTFNFTGWDDIPEYAQFDYPSDCLWAIRLAESTSGYVERTEPICFSPAQRDLLQAGYQRRGTGFAYPSWSFKLPGENATNHIEGLAWYNTDEFALVTDVTQSLLQPSYEISRFHLTGAFIGTLPILSSIDTSGGTNPRKINLDGVDLKVSIQLLTESQGALVGSDTEHGLRVVGEYYEAKASQDSSRLDGWENMGAFVALINPIDGSTLEQRIYPGRTAGSITSSE